MSIAMPEPVAPAGTVFKATAAIGYGWRRTWKNFWWILLLSLVVSAVFMVVSLVSNGASLTNADFTDPQSVTEAIAATSIGILAIIGAIVQALASTLVNLGLIRIGLDVTAGQPINIGRLFSFQGFGRYVGGSIIIFLIISIGMGIPVGIGAALSLWQSQVAYVIVGVALGIILAIVLTLGFSMFGFTILEKDVRGLGSLGASWQIVKPRFGSLLGMHILLALLIIAIFLVAIIAGILMIVVGLLITVPIAVALSLGVTFLAQAYAYRTLSGQDVR